MRRSQSVETPTLCDRKTAQQNGLPRYFTGEPCIRGHIAERTTANGVCLACASEKSTAKYWSDPEKHREEARKFRSLDPEGRRARARAAYRANPEAHKEHQRRMKARNRAEFSGPTVAEAVCRACKCLKPASEFNLDRARKSGLAFQCKACSRIAFKKWKQTDGYEKRLIRSKAARRTLKAENPRLRWASMAKNAAKARTKQRGCEMTLTAEWIYDAAGDMCPLLGIKLDYSRSTMGPDSPAIDRIDNDKGYTPDNCWVISSLANRIKTDANPEQVLLVGQNLMRRRQERLDGCKRASEPPEDLA